MMIRGIKESTDEKFNKRLLRTSQNKFHTLERS